jgi:hypothetical protein
MFMYKGSTPDFAKHITIEYTEGDITQSFKIYHDFIDRDDTYLQHERLDTDIWAIVWRGEFITFWSECDEKGFDVYRVPDITQTFTIKKTPERLASLLKAISDWSDDYNNKLESQGHW